ncbi:MAG: AMP-binding protein [Proteobacteria bacterium]|nr:AMP-binding protein [Pseudomonadota bacterium]MBU1639655.1 AMP-binding protein [Pseudomonadota bacterium]
MSKDCGIDDKAELLLAEVRQLVSELHQQSSYALNIALDSDLERDLGLDSLARVELLRRLEKRFGVHLAEKVLAMAESPRDLLRCLQGAWSPGPTPGPTLAVPAHPDQEADAASGAGTLVDVLAWHGQRQPERLHLSIYSEGELRDRITFGALAQGAAAVACGLQQQGIEPGQRVALMLPTSPDYFFSFFGVLLAGAIPVPLYPPARPTQIEEHLRRHIGILNNSLASLLITVPEVQPLARLLKAQAPAMQGSRTVPELTRHGTVYQAQEIKGEDTAFLQYTSGSTGIPKGVVLSHANLLANIRAMGRCIEASSRDVFVSWLPLYHDMGLIGAWLGSLYYGCQLVIMSPLAFLVHPENWLWAIHRHRGTLSAAPNFGYEFCLNKISDLDIDGLDLSSWRLAFNGAEPVSPTTVQNFPTRFKAYGFKEEAMAPVYGLAESTVGLAFPPLPNRPTIDRIQRQPFMTSGQAIPARADDDSGLRFVACGQALAGHEIRIVDANDQELPPRQEGHLQFRGPSATSGYFRNSRQSKELFHGSWLDSGDLAYLADQRLYITSRTKDIIIHGGRNIYPAELEEAVGQISGIRKGCVVVFGSRSATTETERLIVLAETRDSAPERLAKLHSAINGLVTDRVGLPPDQVLLMPPHTILKTSSGKLRRSATRDLYEQGRLGRKGRSVWWQLLRLALAGLIPQLRQLLNKMGEQLYAGYCWCLYYLLGGTAWLLIFLLPRPSWRWTVLRGTMRLLARLTLTALTVKGSDQLSRQRPVVLVANHLSYLDALVLAAALPVNFSFVAKAELQERLLFRIFMSRLAVEFVERSDVEQGVSATRRIVQNGSRGKSLLFFAEGTLQRLPGLLPFHMGAFVTAAQAGLPVVPVTIRGTREKMPSGSWLPRRGRITVTISQALEPPGHDWQAAVTLRDQARAEILRHCGEPDLAGTRPPLRGPRHENGER